MASSSGSKAEPGVEEDLVAALENLTSNDHVKALLDTFNASEPENTELNVGGQSAEGQVVDRRPFEFLDKDEDFQKKLANGGANPSASVDQWARNRLNRFRVCIGVDASLPFEELPTVECVKLLCKFFERVAKVNGELYPTYTLMGLYQAFNRMLRRHQEKRIIQTGKEEVPMNMRHCATFKSVGVACVLAMERSRDAGANKPRKKAAVVSFTTKEIILGHVCTQITHPRGLQNRTFYFLDMRFAIRGGEELYKVLKGNFIFGSDENGEYVRYDERLSKNNKVGMDCYQDEHFRPPVTNYDPNVVATFRAMLLHLPPAVLYIFMQVIDHPRTIYWFSLSRAGEKTIGNLMKTIHKECGLDVEGVMNKSGRTMAVTRMAMAGVPAVVGAKLTGHKTLDAYQRYDRSVEAHVMAAQKCIEDGSSFEDHLKVESHRFKKMVIYGELASEQLPKKSANLKMKSKVVDGGGTQRMEGIYIDTDESVVEEVSVEVTIKEEPAVKVEFQITQEQEGGSKLKRKVVDDDEKEVKSMIKPPKSVKREEMGATDLKTALKEWDAWADLFDWKTFEAKVLEGRSVKINPVTAVFGHVENMQNCNVTINIQSISSG